MLILGFLGIDFTAWTTWLVLVVGVVVAALVIVLGILFGRWRRRRRVATASREEDLPWDQILELLRQHKRGGWQPPAGPPAGDEAGLAPEDDMPPEELIKQLRSGLGSMPRASSKALPEELQFLETGGVEKRGSRRRWGNPTEVHLFSSAWFGKVHGLVINRSTGGLAIVVDIAIEVGASVQVRSAEAPRYVAAAEVEVRYCRPIGKNFLTGCRFTDDVPWNVRVWFG
jgi:hypothetical protein